MTVVTYQTVDGRFIKNYNEAKKVYNEDGSIVTSMGENNQPVAEPLNDVEGMPGKTLVCIYWEPPNGADRTDNASKMDTKDGLILHVDVTCESASQSYTVEKKFQLKVFTYKPLQDLSDRSRQDALIAASENAAVNPCGFSEETDINIDEMWSWQLVNEE